MVAPTALILTLLMTSSIDRPLIAIAASANFSCCASIYGVGLGIDALFSTINGLPALFGPRCAACLLPILMTLTGVPNISIGILFCSPRSILNTTVSYYYINLLRIMDEKEIKKKAAVKATKKYQQTEKGKATLKKYLQSEKAKEKIRRCQQSEKNKEYMKNYRDSETGKEYMKNYHAKYDKSEKARERKKEQRKTERGKITQAKAHAKRRGLEYIRLNDPFPNSEGHHIDKKHIVYIPKEDHQRIRHNLHTGQGIDKINAIAFEYISEDMFNKFVSGKM